MLRPLPLTFLLALAACGGAPDAAEEKPAAVPAPAAQPFAASAADRRPVAVPAEIAAFYAARHDRPLWVTSAGPRPEAAQALQRLQNAGADGLDPNDYSAAAAARALAAAQARKPQALARLELLLSSGIARYVRDLKGHGRSDLIEVEPGLVAPPPSLRTTLEALAAAPSLREGLASVTRMNPLYSALRRGAAAWFAVSNDPGTAARVRANLDRARAIPASGGRYIIVDAASARLWMVEGDKVEGPMRVVVGKPGMQTPLLADRIGYVVLNPWWNVPPDLARERAKRVLREGPGLIAAQRLDILSDWSDAARPISASAVNWRAVAAGQETLRLRQQPGGDNFMGAMKFMMGNRLGIYLHDFPDKTLFDRADRMLSSGCVRLSDAPRLASWLFRGKPPAARPNVPEQAVPLPQAVPVYITYLTVLPDGGSLSFQPDPYRRDGTRPGAERG